MLRHCSVGSSNSMDFKDTTLELHPFSWPGPHTRDPSEFGNSNPPGCLLLSLLIQGNQWLSSYLTGKLLESRAEPGILCLDSRDCYGKLGIYGGGIIEIILWIFRLPSKILGSPFPKAAGRQQGGSKDAVEAPSLEVLRTRLDRTWNNLIQRMTSLSLAGVGTS